MSVEFAAFPSHKSDQKELQTLYREYSQMLPKAKNMNPRIIKVVLLLVAHMNRRKLSKQLTSDLAIILEKLGSMIETMVSIGFTIGVYGSRGGKKVGLRVLCFLIELA